MKVNPSASSAPAADHDERSFRFPGHPRAVSLGSLSVSIHPVDAASQDM